MGPELSHAGALALVRGATLEMSFQALNSKSVAITVDQIKFLFSAQSQKLFLIAALRGISWLIVNVLSNVLLSKSLPMFEISSFLLLSSEMWNEDYLPFPCSSL